MRLIYLISIQARTVTEAVRKIGIDGEGIVVDEPVVVTQNGAGTELKKLIAKFGLVPASNCKCAQHIREMDRSGIEWCKEEITTIVEWLREEAKRARLPFTEIGAKILIRRAIHNAQKNQQKEQDMTVKLVIEIDTDDPYEALERTKPKEGKVTAVSSEPARPVPPTMSQPTRPPQPTK